jgi:hypothetical protein
VREGVSESYRSSWNRLTLGVRISDTSAMANRPLIGGDVEQALEHAGVPSYVLDTTGIVRWINPAAELYECLG